MLFRSAPDPIIACRLTRTNAIIKFANPEDCTKGLNLNGIPFLSNLLNITQPDSLAPTTLASETLSSPSQVGENITQSVGVDTLFSINYDHDGNRTVFPSEYELEVLGSCLRAISIPNAIVLLSSCGGEQDSKDQYHFWYNKEEAQDELSQALNMAVVTGLGPVSAVRSHPEEQITVTAKEGWHFSKPTRQPVDLAQESYQGGLSSLIKGFFH